MSLSKIMKLMCDHQTTIMEDTPTSTVLLRDNVGNWDFRDMEVIWANTAAKLLMPKETVDGGIHNVSEGTLNGIVADFYLVRQKVVDGHVGFVGPFSYHTTDKEGNTVYLEYRVLHLGTVETKPVHLVLTNDVTAQHYYHKLAETGRIPNKGQANRLSDRERCVASLIVQGMTTKEIASELGISERTIENHRTNIRKKVGLTDRTISLAECLGNF